MLLFQRNLRKGEPGFAVGDTETGITAYADRTSIWDNRSYREPETVAREMIAFAETVRHDIPHIAWEDRCRLSLLLAARMVGDCGSCERE